MQIGHEWNRHVLEVHNTNVISARLHKLEARDVPSRSLHATFSFRGLIKVHLLLLA